jgi:glucosylceramidase
VTIDSQTKEVTYSGQYWAMAHHSRAIRRGAKRIQSSGDVTGVSHVAAANPDGSTALVLANAASATKVRLALGQMTAEIPLPADSVVTLTWS